ncbi:MAG: aspartate--tRNA(Asn) ligase [bacterium]
MRTHIGDLKGQLGQTVIVSGFAQAIRNQGKIAFMRLRDVTGSIQIVILGHNEVAFNTIKSLSVESVVTITGLCKEAGQVPEGIEIECETIEVLSAAAPLLPIPVAIEKGSEDVDVSNRFDWRWLDLRLPEKQQIFKVWTALETGMRKYFTQNGFIQLYSPNMMSTASEGGAEFFEVKYFDRKAYLAQSPQFYKQMAMASGMEKVFMVGPVFRAEESFTTRHMTEFTGWDAEIAYIESHHDVMDMEEALLISAFTEAKNVLPELVIPTSPFPRLVFGEVKRKLAKLGIKSEKEHDLTPEEEREICKLVKEETGSDFVFIIDYPFQGRAFYHMRHADKNQLTKGFDLLYKGLEITTGAQREHRLDILEKQALEKGVDLDSIKDYLNFFRYGCPPHGGIGMGPGRIVMKILDLDSVKEATFLPRDVKRLRP